MTATEVPAVPAASQAAPKPRIPPARWLAVALAVLACGVYAGVLHNGFATDDVPIVQANPVVHQLGGNLRALLLGAYWPGSGELYRPLTLLSLAVDWSVFHGSAAAIHAENALLHAGVTLLLFALLLRLGASTAGAVAGAALFAVHPVHVEAVASVVGRAELLSALFALAACNLYLRGEWSVQRRIAWVTACYFLALAAKEIAVTLPALLLLLDLFAEPRRSVNERWRRNCGMIAACTLALAAYLAIRWRAIGALGGSLVAPYLADLSTGHRLATAASLWPQYLRLLLWPADLSSEWGPGVLPTPGWSDAAPCIGIACVAVVAALAVVQARRGRGWLALAAAWFAVSILPASQVFFPIGTLLAERTLYLPSACVALAAAGLFAAVGPRSVWREGLIAGVLALVVLGGVRSWTRVPSWQSTAAVQQQLAADHPESWRVQWVAAGLSASQGRTAEALQEYERALEFTHRSDYRVNMEAAQFLFRIGRGDEAEALLRRSIALIPHFPIARVLLGARLLSDGRDREALALARETLGLLRAPDVRATMHHFAALAYDGLGRPDSALALNDSIVAVPSPMLRGPAWLHRSRLEHLAGRDSLARVALDSARAQLPPGAAPADVLHLPGPASPAMRGWGLSDPGARP